MFDSLSHTVPGLHSEGAADKASEHPQQTTGPTAAHEAAVPAALPLTPAWVTALQAPEVRQGPWRPWPPAEQREPPPRRCQATWADDDENPNTAQEHDTPAPGDALDHPAERPPDGWSGHALGAQAWAELPAALRAELGRRRGVLLVAPLGGGQRGLMLCCLGFDSRGRPGLRRWAARGAAPARRPGVAAEWLLWRVRRESDDGQRVQLSARHEPGESGATALTVPLALRATASALAPPLCPAGSAWLDVLEPQRLWRELGSQWTLLLAWSPCPLALGCS